MTRVNIQRTSKRLLEMRGALRVHDKDVAIVLGNSYSQEIALAIAIDAGLVKSTTSIGRQTLVVASYVYEEAVKLVKDHTGMRYPALVQRAIREGHARYKPASDGF